MTNDNNGTSLTPHESKTTELERTMISFNEIPLDKLKEAVKNFTRLQSIDQLSIQWDRTPKYNCQRSVEEFKRALAEFPGGVSQNPALEREIELTELDTPGYKYNPHIPYYSSNVCFQTLDSMASANTMLKNSKLNTHILCPFCDPFAEAKKPNSSSEMKKTTIGGVTYRLPKTAPIHSFYNTLGTKYVHHMSGCHGLRKNGDAEEPIMGFVGNEMDLCIICPHVSNGKPCLGMTKFFGTKKTSEPGFKGYYRHYGSTHLCNGARDLQRYSKKDLFVPLDHDKCMKATKGQASHWFKMASTPETERIIKVGLSRVNVSAHPYEQVELASDSSVSPFMLSQSPVQERVELGQSYHPEPFFTVVPDKAADIYLSGSSLNVSYIATALQNEMDTSAAYNDIPDLTFDDSESVNEERAGEEAYPQDLASISYIQPTNLDEASCNIDPSLFETLPSPDISMSYPAIAQPQHEDTSMAFQGSSNLGKGYVHEATGPFDTETVNHPRSIPALEQVDNTQSVSTELVDAVLRELNDLTSQNQSSEMASTSTYYEIPGMFEDEN